MALTFTIQKQGTREFICLYPNAYLLLNIICCLADSNNKAEIKPSLTPLTPEEYRTALRQLCDNNIVEIITTKKGNGGHTYVYVMVNDITQREEEC